MKTSHGLFVCRFAVLLTLLAVGTHTALPRLSAAAESVTPAPMTPALTGPFAYGVASGDMTSDSAVLWTRTPQIGGDLNGTKSWAGAYNCERNKLLKFIDDNAIDNVVFLTTDNHYTVINNLKYNTVPDDPQSPQRTARNAFEILTGPLGAVAGKPPGLKVDTKDLSRREADRQILAVWNGDSPNADGKQMGLKQAGLDPIGLEADFPGLDAASIHSADGKPATVEPVAFASFNTYSYAVLTFDRSSLHVQVKSMPIVPDPSALLNADAEKEYEHWRVEETLSFTIKAQ